jgi:hypothetical protein
MTFGSFGPKRTWASALQMSAFGGKADMPYGQKIETVENTVNCPFPA